MERHHFDQCLMILSSQVIHSSHLYVYLICNFNSRLPFIIQGCQILSNVTSDEYTKIIKVLEEAILSTDLAVYFGCVHTLLPSGYFHDSDA